MRQEHLLSLFHDKKSPVCSDSLHIWHQQGQLVILRIRSAFQLTMADGLSSFSPNLTDEDRHGHQITPGETPALNGLQNDGNSLPDSGKALSEEQRIFNHVTRPDDAYTEDGVYWADLPLGQRFSFVTKIDAQASLDEVRVIGRMIKKDPLSPLAWYIRNAVIPGAGLGLEGYVLFSIGNLEPLFAKVWPACWKTHEVCSKNWVASVTYLEILGIMVGQGVVGVSLVMPPQIRFSPPLLTMAYFR